MYVYYLIKYLMYTSSRNDLITLCKLYRKYTLGTYTTNCSKMKMNGKKTEPVPIQLPKASTNFPNLKTRNDFFFYNWTSKIIPFIHLGKQMDWT